jgi:hypothetical protein
VPIRSRPSQQINHALALRRHVGTTLLVHIVVQAIDQDPGPGIARTETGLHCSLNVVAVTITTEKAREQALTDLEARQEGTAAVLHHKKGPGDMSRNVNDRVQEALTATQASPMTELLYHRDEILLHQCSVRGA